MWGENTREELSKMNCRQIADQIDIFLKKFEKDPMINIRDKEYGTSDYYTPIAFGTTKVNIRYVSYQSTWKLSKEEGLKYLKWLREGNVGTHYDMEVNK
jgi:hypothetical protein